MTKAHLLECLALSKKPKKCTLSKDLIKCTYGTFTLFIYVRRLPIIDNLGVTVYNDLKFITKRAV